MVKRNRTLKEIFIDLTGAQTQLETNTTTMKQLFRINLTQNMKRNSHLQKKKKKKHTPLSTRRQMFVLATMQIILFLVSQ